MGDVLTATQLVDDASIANRAMKVVFHRGMGAARRTRDATAEAMIKQQFGDEGQIVTRKLFQNKSSLIYKRNQLANEMYDYHVKHTLPHGDDGSRLLPNTVYLDYVQKMAGYESQLGSLDAMIVATYDHLVQADIAERNAALTGQAKPATAASVDYPGLEQIKRSMYVKWVIEPIATAGDFRYNVDDSVIERLNGRLKEIEAEASASLLLRLSDPMKAFVEKLSVPIGETGSVFRNSLVENLNELVAFLPKLNVNDDMRVKYMVAEIQSVITPYTGNGVEVLREVPEARAAARRKMKTLMDQLSGYGLGG